MRQINNFICFGLEGPLSLQDNAYELIKLFPNGDRVFEVISRYDDLLTLEEREGYEPGDTSHFHWLSGRKDIHDVIEIHKRIRRLVREEAGKLGWPYKA